MLTKKDLIRDLKSQRAALDRLVERLQESPKLGLVDYRICESTAEAVGKGLERIRSLSIEEFVQESLWGKDA